MKYLVLKKPTQSMKVVISPVQFLTTTTQPTPILNSSHTQPVAALHVTVHPQLLTLSGSPSAPNSPLFSSFLGQVLPPFQSTLQACPTGP